MELLTNVIECSLYEVDSTGVNIAKELAKIFQYWGIADKIVAITSDNAANMKTAIETELKMTRIGCTAHSLNLVVKSAFGNTYVGEVLEKVHSLSTAFRRPGTQRALHEAQKSLGWTQPLNLKLSCPTHWN